MTNNKLYRVWSAGSLLSLSLALGLAACSKDNPNYCEGAPNNSCAQVDAGAEGCTSSAECAAPTGVCDVGGTNTCVACTTAEADACTGTTPVCGPANACQGCTTHAECAASNVCLPTGACADAATVAYVAPAGTGTTCTQTAPCGTLAAALLTTRPVVKFGAGVVKDSGMTVIDGRAVTIVASPGAVLDRDGDGPVLEVRNANANVSVYDLAVSGATGTSGANGIQLVGNGGNPQLRLERATVSGNQGAGITTSGGTLTVTRSTLTQNQGGGLDMTALGVVTLTDNVVHHNGNNVTAEFGGLRLRPMAGSKVEFNTIVDNQAITTSSSSTGGVFCEVPTFVAAGNVIFRNTGGASLRSQTFGTCTYGSSFVAMGADAADNTPMFVKPNAMPFDYHLTAATPTTILNAGGACTGSDLDGDARPQGGACDLGADELVP